MATKIYTKTGDDGTTSLGTHRISKTDSIVEVMGELDLLQSYLGLVDAHLSEKSSSIRNDVRIVQYHLYNLASQIHRNYKPASFWSFQSLQKILTCEIFFRDVICDLFSTCWKFIFQVAPENVLPNPGEPSGDTGMISKEWLEERMDDMSRDLPPLTHFIRPGGEVLVASIHLCRSVCRKLEIKVHNAVQESCLTREDAKVLNRMSDWLFVLARHCHFILNPEKEEHRIIFVLLMILIIAILTLVGGNYG